MSRVAKRTPPSPVRSVSLSHATPTCCLVCVSARKMASAADVAALKSAVAAKDVTKASTLLAKLKARVHASAHAFCCFLVPVCNSSRPGG